MNDQLLVFSDDWGRHPSSCQHLIRNLLPDVSATWVNTIGMRPPRMDWLTVKRASEKIGGWLNVSKNEESNGGTHEIPNGLSVIDAKMWPWMSHRWDRALNQHLLKGQLSSVAQNAIGVTTLPIIADLTKELRVKRWVYYCVDDFSVWPGLSGSVLQKMERELVERVDVVIAASEHLADSIRPYHSSVHVLTHGVDRTFWSQPKAQFPGYLSAFESPLIVFWGVVDRRMNAEWVLALADALTSGTIILAGPQQDPDPRLLAHTRIAAIGSLPISELPTLAQSAALLIMPYADLAVTRAMQPLKLKEYLATGRPVVASSLPAVVEWQDCLSMVSSQTEFIDQCLAVTQGNSAISRHSESFVASRLESEDWTSKAATFRSLLTG